MGNFKLKLIMKSVRFTVIQYFGDYIYNFFLLRSFTVPRGEPKSHISQLNPEVGYFFYGSTVYIESLW